MPRNRVQDAFRAALTVSGITTRASVHTLRHRDAPPLREAGVNLRLIQAYVGHASPTTPALSPPLTLNADAMAREALAGLMNDLDSDDVL
jgi:integrase